MGAWVHGFMRVYGFMSDMCVQNMILIGELQKEKQSEEWQSYTEEQKKEVFINQTIISYKPAERGTEEVLSIPYPLSHAHLPQSRKCTTHHYFSVYHNCVVPAEVDCVDIYILSISFTHVMQLQQKLSEATQMAKNRNLLASETVEILRLITASVQAPFVLPTMVDRFTAMLNYVLKQLVGPKRRQLNVSYNAELSNIVAIYTCK